MPSRVKDILYGLAALVTLGHFITSSVLATDFMNDHDYLYKVSIQAVIGIPADKWPEISTSCHAPTTNAADSYIPPFHGALFRAIVNGLAFLYFVFQYVFVVTFTDA